MTQTQRPSEPRSPKAVVLQVLHELHKVPELHEADLKMLARWISTGISLSSYEQLPNLSTVVNAARKAVLAEAYERHRGCITHTGRAIGLGRRATRDYLRKFGLISTPEKTTDEI